MNLLRCTGVFLLITSLFSCQPAEFVEIERDPFVVYNMEVSEMPAVPINPVLDGSKKLIVFASHPKDSIAGFMVRNQSIDLEVVNLKCLMVDTRDSVKVNDGGNLSRKVSTVIFEYTVRVPKNAQPGQQYRAEFVIVSGKGEERVVDVGFNLVGYFRAPTLLTAFNGQVKNSMKEYLPSANCFIGFSPTTSVIVDPDDPAIRDTLQTGITAFVRNPSLATNAANRPNIVAHIFTEIRTLRERIMYLVSPDESWIGDSLRILNNFTAPYPADQMNHVRFVDLGVINFLDMTDDVLDQVDFDRDGQTKLQLHVGNSYAFRTEDGRKGVIFFKFVHIYTPAYSQGSPVGYFHLNAKT